MQSGRQHVLWHLNPWQACVRSGGLPLYCLQLVQVEVDRRAGPQPSQFWDVPLVCSPQNNAHPLPSV